nr:glutathione S-transferase [Oceanococcus sp. HetDA_MAG_MS8]
MSDPAYTLYKMDISYFSGKVEAYLHYKGIAHHKVTATAKVLDQIYQATGVKKVPAIACADGRWLFDSTPMLEWLEQQHPEPVTKPDDPALAFLAQLIEDYADEWLWRPAMWWRWEPKASRHALGRRIAEEVRPPGVPTWLMSWFFPQRQRWTWLWGDGMNRQNSPRVRDLYREELAFLQATLSHQPFLLGQQPSAADFGYFASMFRHFGNDPDPAEIMRRDAPAVYLWLARLWAGVPAASATRPSWVWPEGQAWQVMLKRIQNDYLPYLSANAEAFATGKKRFDFVGDSQQFSGTVVHRYRVWCRERLQQSARGLSPHDQQRIANLLGDGNGWTDLTQGPMISSGLEGRYQLPIMPRQAKPQWRVALFGQPRD